MNGRPILRPIPRQLRSRTTIRPRCRWQKGHRVMMVKLFQENSRCRLSPSSYLRLRIQISMTRTSNRGLGHGRTSTRIDSGLGRTGSMVGVLSRSSKATRMESCACNSRSLRTYLPRDHTMQLSRFGTWTTLKKHGHLPGTRAGFALCNSIRPSLFQVAWIGRCVCGIGKHDKPFHPFPTSLIFIISYIYITCVDYSITDNVLIRNAIGEPGNVLQPTPVTPAALSACTSTAIS